MAKKMFAAAAKRHKHVEGNITIKFDGNGKFETTDAEVKKILKKWNGKYWSITGEHDEEELAAKEKLAKTTEEELKSRIAQMVVLNEEIPKLEAEKEKLLTYLKSVNGRIKAAEEKLKAAK